MRHLFLSRKPRAISFKNLLLLWRTFDTPLRAPEESMNQFITVLQKRVWCPVGVHLLMKQRKNMSVLDFGLPGTLYIGSASSGYQWSVSSRSLILIETPELNGIYSRLPVMPIHTTPHVTPPRHTTGFTNNLYQLTASITSLQAPLPMRQK